MTMLNTSPEDRFRQTGWPGVRARLFHLYFLLARPMTLGVRGVIFDRDANAVFLIEHTYVPGWQLPGGGVEPGETMLDALARELMEEGNIELTAPPELKSIHHNRHASRRDHVGVYLVTGFRQTAPHVPDREIKAAGFFALDALPENTTPGTLRRIEEVLGGAGVSAWW
ncbi:MAG: NUDIX domain-containing protein [Mesorhizobium sp.]|nr:NUDIX domain-containing protein [Mesorhizobium sp.]